MRSNSSKVLIADVYNLDSPGNGLQLVTSKTAS